MFDQFKDLAGDPRVLIGGAILALILLILAARGVRRLAKVRNLAEKAVAPVMFGGMIWSAEAIWLLTKDVNVGVRIATFAVLEFMLLIAMARAKESMRVNGHPGISGQSAWLFASVIALVAFVAGVFLYHSIVEAILRPAIPLLLTKLWWDGIVGEGRRKTGSFKWTPRWLLIQIGAIEEDDRDVKTVNRDRLIQRMTDMYYASLYGPEKKRDKIRSKLARKTLDADDEMIAEVMRRVRRTGWTTAEPLPYDPTQATDAADDAPMTHTLTRQMTQPDAARDADVARPPTRRVRAATSGDAADAGKAMQAALLYMTQPDMSYRKAADAVGGTSEPSVRRKVKELRDASTGAPGDADLTHPQTNGHPVLANQN